MRLFLLIAAGLAVALTVMNNAHAAQPGVPIASRQVVLSAPGA